jgi:hypothetical protein
MLYANVTWSVDGDPSSGWSAGLSLLEHHVDAVEDRLVLDLQAPGRAVRGLPARARLAAA